MRMMPAGLFLGSLTPNPSPRSLTPSPSPKERGVIRLEGVVRETREEGKRCSRAAPNPTSWIQKGKGKRKEGKKGKMEEKDRRERGRKKGGKAEEREVFYKKIGFCKFLLGLYKRILEKKVYICNMRIRNR